MAGNDVKLELEVEALLTPGKTNTDKLERAMAAALSSIKTPKLELTPEISLKFDGNKGQVKRALKKSTQVLQSAIEGEWGEVTKMTSKAVSSNLQKMETSVLLSVKEAYEKIGAALAQPLPSKFKDAGFLRQIQLVMGDPAEYDKLNKNQKRKVQEYIQFSKQQVGQMQQVANSLNSLNRLRQGKNGESLFASPISLPKVQQDLKILKEYNAALEKSTSIGAAAKRVKDKADQESREQTAADKDEEKRYQAHLKRMSEMQAKSDAEERSRQQALRDNAYASIQELRKEQTRQKNEEIRQTQKAVTGRGDELINKVGLANVGTIDKGEQANIQAALRERIKGVRDEMAQQLLQGKQNEDGYKSNVRTLGQLNGALKESQTAMNRTGVATKDLGDKLDTSGGLLRNFFRYAIGYGALYQALSAITALGRGLVDLDKQLYSIQAVSGATNNEMLSIESAIKTVAQETKFSVNEIAEAAKTLAQAGTDPKNFAGTLKATAAFAAATESSIATAADLMTTLKTVYSELDDLTATNQLTKAVNISKLSADDLKTILSLSSQVAKSYNLTSDQYLAAVTTLRNAGLKASTVATGLRESLLEVFNPDTKTVKALKKRYMEIGEKLSTDDVKARFFEFTQEANPLVSLLRELDRLGFNGDGRQTLGRAFDVHATNALSALVSNLKELESSSANISFGNASLVGSATQMQSLANATENLGGAILNMADSLVGDAVPVLQKFVVFLTDAVDKITALNDEMRAATGNGLGSSVAAGGVGAVLGAITAGGGFKRRLAGGLAGGAAATAVSGGAEAGGVGGAVAAGAGIVSTILLAFDILKRIRGVKQAAATVEAGAEVATGVISSIGKLAGLRGLALAGLRITGWGAIAALGVEVLFQLADAFSEAGGQLEKIKVRSQQSQANTQKALQEYEGSMDAIDSLRPSSPDNPATAGKSRSEVEKLQKLATLTDAEISRFFNVTGADLEKTKEILAALSDKGNTEAGSGSRDALIKKLSEVTGQTVDSLKKSDFTFAAYADSLRQVGATTDAIRASLYNEFIRGKELEDAGTKIDGATKALVDTMRTWLTSGDQSLRNKYLKLAGILSSTPQEMVAIIAEATDSAYQTGMAEADVAKQETVKGIQQMFDALRDQILAGVNEEDIKNQINRIIEAKQRLGESQEQVASEVAAFLNDLSTKVKSDISEASRIRNLNLGGPEGSFMMDAQVQGAQRAGANADSLIPYANLTAKAKFNQQNTEAKNVIDKAESSALEKAKQILTLLKDPAYKDLTETVQGRDAVAAVQKQIDSGGRLTVGTGLSKKGVPTTTTDSPDLKTVYDLGASAESRRLKEEEVRKKLADVMVEDLATQKALVDVDKRIAEASRTGANASGLLAEKKNLQVKLINDQIAFQQGKLGRSDDPVEKRNIQNQIQQLELQKYQNESEYVQQSAQSNRDYLNRMDELRTKELDNKARLLEDKTEIAVANGNAEEAQRLIDARQAVLREMIEVEKAKLERQGKTKAEVDAELAERIKIADNLRLSAGDRQNIRDRELKILQRMPTDGGSTDPFQQAKDRANGTAYSMKDKAAQTEAKLQAYMAAEANVRARLDSINPNQSKEAADEALALEEHLRTLRSEMGLLQAATENFGGTFASAMDRGFDVDQISKKLEAQAGTWNDLGNDIQGGVVSGVKDFAGGMAQAVVQGNNLITTMGNLVANSLQAIAQMIIQKQILLAINWALQATGFAGFAEGGSNVQVKDVQLNTNPSGSMNAATGASNVQTRANGGKVGMGERDSSGVISGPGTGTSDSVAAMIVDRKRRTSMPLLVSAGESILTERVTKSLGAETIDRWNRAGVVRMAEGGVVGQDSSTPNIVGGNVYQFDGTKVSIATDPGTSTPEEDKRTGLIVRKMVDERVMALMMELQRPGNLLNKDGKK